MCWNKLTRAAGVVIAGFVAVCAAEAQDRADPRALLRRCLETQSSADSFEADGTTEVEYFGLDGGTRSSLIEYHFLRSGSLFDISQKTTKKQRTTESRIQFTDDYKISAHPKKDGAPAGGVVWSDERGNEIDRLLNCNRSFATPLDGYLSAGNRKRLVEFLLEAKDLNVTDSDGSTIAVAGTTKYGAVTFWIDAARGYCVTRASVRKGSNDLLCMNGKVGEAQLDPRAGEKLSGWTAELQDVELQRVQSVWIPISGTLIVTEEYPSGKKSKQKLHYKRTGIRFHDDADKPTELAPALAKDARVTNMDDRKSGVAYIWDGDKVAPAPVQPPERARGIWPGAESEWRTWLILLNLLAVIILGIWLYLRRR